MSTPTKNEAVVYDGTGKPINLAKPDGLAIPHVFTFAGLLQGAWNTYYHDGSHEGFRHNRENALHMRNDLRLEAAFQERKRAVKILPWRIEVEDESDPKQAVVKDLTTKILNRIPRFRRMLGYLLEAVWWGRYGSQLLFAWEEVCDAEGVPYQVMQPVKHDPIFGDKLGFRHDGTPYVRVYGAAPDIGNIKPIYSTQGPAIPLVGTLRERFLIHTYNPLDADYFDIEGADAKFGVGLSSLGYWQQWVKNEFASWVTEFFEKVGLGLVMVEFESGNTQSEAAADDAIKNLGKRSVIKVPRAAGGTSTWGNTESIRILEVPASGATMIREWIEYFDESFERLIIGQSMSSGSDAEGSLGGSGRANLAKDTKSQIIEDDALDLEETITGSKYEPGLIHTIVKYSFPWVDFPVQFKLGIKPDNSKERMEAIQVAVGMGVSVKEADVREACNVDAPEHGDAIVGGQAGQTPGKFGEGGPFEPPFDQDPQDEDQGGDEGDFEPTEINRWKQSKGKRGGKLWVNESTGEKSYRDHSQHFSDDRHMEQYAADKKTGGHWVTMGGDSEEGGGKHHGGHPVLLDGEGRIIGGNVPRSWQGRHISEAFKPPAKEEAAKAPPAEDDVPAPSEQASKAKPKKAATKQAKSLHSVIKDRGGIDPSKIGGDYNISEEFIQSGLFGVLRKGGTSLDEMASNLHDEGYIKIPEGRNGDDYLLEALHGKYKTMHHQYDAEIEAQQKAYYEELENAKQYANQSEIDEAVRSGQEAGKAEGRESEIGEGLSELADEEGTYSAEDLDFNPSEFETPSEKAGGESETPAAAPSGNLSDSDLDKLIDHANTSANAGDDAIDKGHTDAATAGRLAPAAMMAKGIRRGEQYSPEQILDSLSGLTMHADASKFNDQSIRGQHHAVAKELLSKVSDDDLKAFVKDRGLSGYQGRSNTYDSRASAAPVIADVMKRLGATDRNPDAAKAEPAKAAEAAPPAPAPAKAESKPAKPAKSPKPAASTEDTNASLNALTEDSLKADGQHDFDAIDSKIDEYLGKHSVAELKDIAKEQGLAVLKPTKSGIIGQFKERLRRYRQLAQRTEFRPLNAENKSPDSATNVGDKPKGNATIVDKPATETGEVKKEGGKMSEPKVLKGSPAQVEWANKIRNKLLSGEMPENARNILANHEDAKFWIDNKGYSSPSALVGMLTPEDVRRVSSIDEEDAAIEEEGKRAVQEAKRVLAKHGMPLSPAIARFEKEGESAGVPAEIAALSRPVVSGSASVQPHKRSKESREIAFLDRYKENAHLFEKWKARGFGVPEVQE